MSSWITRRRFDIFDFNENDILIEDIAASLSKQYRFPGHCSEFYSVAQHSVYVSLLCRTTPLWGLLHDASEAYISDIPSLIKRQPIMNEYRKIEERIMKTICKKFDLDPQMPKEVKDADELILANEVRSIMQHPDPELIEKLSGFPVTPFRIIPISWREAEQRFLRRFKELEDYKERLLY